MCPNKDLDKNQRGFMSWDTFKKTVDEAQEFVQDITLHHRGESLMHPEAIRMITYAAQTIQTTKLHTNGTLLDERVIDGLLSSGLNRISISFDGFEAADYEKVRVGANFQHVVENIKRLLTKRKERNQKNPVVVIEVIELSDSQTDPDKKSHFIRSFSGLELDQLLVKKPHNWGGYIHTPFKKRKYTPCTFLWNALLVLWNGDVVPCAQDFFAKQVVGNVTQNSLKEIWRAAPLKKIRKGLVEGNYQEFNPCADCDRLWRETFLGVPTEYLKQFLLNKMP